MRNKKFTAIAVSALTAMSMASAMPMTANAENPIVQTSFTPDPAPVVIGDELYVFTGSDREGDNDFYKMTGWQCFSTKDMKNWTDHGRILEDDDFSWCNENDAWASQCIERNGKFYFYFTTTNKSGGGRAIGVAVADKPEGPYEDVLGKPLCGPNWDYIDPTVIIDDDGQAWLMFGNPKCYYVKLKEDMVTLDGEIKQFDMNTQQFGPASNNRTCTYGEGPWIYKHDKLYYLVWASFVDGFGGESQCYATGPSVTGPWTYRGVIQEGSNCFTTHGGIIDYKDHSYFFYHKNGLPGGGAYNRSASCEEFTYNSDGSIPVVKPTSEGPSQLEALDPFQRVEAETICWSEGIKTEKCSEGGVNIGNIEKGDYIKVSGVDFGDGATKFTASVASNTEGGTIELHTGSKSGPVIGACQVKGTGGWQSWEEVSCDVKVSGKQDLYLVFNGGSGYLLNVDWWKFSGAGSAETTTTTATTKSNATTTTTTSGKTATTTTIGKTADTGDYIFNDTFESGDNDWTSRGSAKVSSSSTKSYQGSKALYCSGREASWNGALKELGSSFKAGESYSFSANICPDGGKDGDVYYLTMEYSDANEDYHYEKIAKAQPMKGEWVQLANSNFKIPSDAVDNIHIYVETEKSTASFYVDDVKAAKAGTVIEGAQGKQYILGDINGDGSINVFDVILGRKGLIKGFSNDTMKTLADVDQSTEFEINDLVLLQNFVKGKETEFPNNAPEPPKSDFNYNANLQVKDAPGDYLNPCSQAGKITKETYNGIRGTKSLNVYTPYNYDPSKKYNIFYLMHGGGENENTIFSNDVKLQNILDHMIMNGELEPLIVVTPTFNGTGSEAGNFWDELKQSVVPFVEGKYSTYAESTSLADLQASRMHRAYGGFSMGGLSTWCVADHDMDIVGYFMPLSGNNWEGMNKLTAEIDSLGLSQREYFIMACTGDEDIAYNNMKPEMEDLKTKSKYFTYTSDFSQGNLYWLVAPGRTHWWGYVRHYIYDALPYFFHEGQ